MAVKSYRLFRCTPVYDLVAHVGKFYGLGVDPLVKYVGVHKVVVHILPSNSSRQHVGHLKAEAGVMSDLKTSYRSQCCEQC
jgi:hypothetical protein